MNLRLSWDLFIIVFFSIVTAYSLIIGRNGTLKVIIATYISILCSDGLGNLFALSMAKSAFFQKLISFFGIGGGINQTVAITKIGLFIALIVALTIHGVYTVELEEHGKLVSWSLMIFLAVLSGGLIVSTIIVFANGGSLINGAGGISQDFMAVYDESRLIKIMLDWHDLWFSLPGLALIVLSLIQSRSK